MENQQLWEKCVAFHGHSCGGLTIGFRGALYAAQLLGLTFSPDEEVVCIAENDACGIDGIQVVLGCTVGKGNLLFHITGKQAWSFYDRKTGNALRLVLKVRPQGKTREELLVYFRDTPAAELFDVKPAVLALPEPAQIFDSFVCEGCGEETGANWIRIQNGRHLCPDCAQRYDRFHV